MCPPTACGLARTALQWSHPRGHFAGVACTCATDSDGVFALCLDLFGVPSDFVALCGASCFTSDLPAIAPVRRIAMSTSAAHAMAAHIDFAAKKLNAIVAGLNKTMTNKARRARGWRFCAMSAIRLDATAKARLTTPPTPKP